MLPYQFLIEYDIFVLKPSLSRYFPAINFSIYVGERKSVFGSDDHQIQW